MRVLFQKFFGCRHRRIGGDAELGIDVLVGTAGAKAVHSDKGTGRAKKFGADITVPAFARGRFDS